MSEVMLEGVIRMPYRLAMEDEFSRVQFYQRAQEALIELSMAHKRAEKADQQRDALLAAVKQIIEENGHLADGDICTLKVLKDAIAEIEQST